MCNSPRISKIIIDEDELEVRCEELAAQISKNYEGKRLTVIVVMNGAIFFAVDLLKRISVPVQFDTLSVSSYIGTESSKQVRLRTKLKLKLENENVLVIDDIFDTGSTLGWITEYLNKKNPSSIGTCVLLSKNKSRTTDFIPDYIGFEIANEFVVGYGLDYNELFRNLPHVGVLQF